MKMQEALDIINNAEKGFMVSFEERGNGLLKSNHFPERRSGEDLIETEEEAWDLANKFANATDVSKYVNIYVTDASYKPVKGYEQKIIRKH